MKKARVVSVALVLLVPGVLAAWYFLSRPSEDQLHDTLKSLGYFPIEPPSNLMSVGSLYYVDSEVKSFTTICSADADDLKDAVIKSPSTKMLADELYSGGFSIGIKLDAGTIGTGHGDIGDKYVRKVHYSLSDVQLYEIPLGANRRIYNKLMARQDCSDAVKDNIYSSGYICQGQRIMVASVEYDLSAQGASMSREVGRAEIAESLKDQVGSSVRLVEKEGRLVTGAALEYGVAMNPACMAPPHARFERILPTTALDRLINFVEFRVLEPILPGT
jgi:hypothetical protein